MGGPIRRKSVYTEKAVEVDGKKVEFQRYARLDANGNGTNYVELRDLGTAPGFKVDWSAARGIYIETK